MSLIKTCINCIFITVAFSPLIFFAFKDIFVNYYAKFHPQGSYNLGSNMRVSTVCIESGLGFVGTHSILVKYCIEYTECLANKSF